MDGEINGKPYFLMDDLGGTKTYFRKQPHGCIGSIVEFGWV